MKKIFFAVLAAILINLTFMSVVSAQTEGLQLSLSRDFGYESFGGDIQGTFTIKASGLSNLERVQFFMDETLLGEDTEAPFAIQFVTDDYPNGNHVFSAVGYTTDGKPVNSQTISAIFVSKKEGSAAALKLIVPILVVVLGAKGIAALSTKSNMQKGNTLPAGTPRNYPFGGAICPKCKRPFGFQFLGLNLIGGKFVPCPHCGKWSFVKRALINELRNAELAELNTEKMQIPKVTDEGSYQKDLDDSKYQNL